MEVNKRSCLRQTLWLVGMQIICESAHQLITVFRRRGRLSRNREPYCSTNNCSCTCCRAYTFAGGDGGVRQSTFHTFYVGDLDNDSWGNRTLNPSPYPVLTCLCRSESCCRGRRSHTGWVSVELLTRRAYRAGRTFEYGLWPQDFYLDKPSLNLFTRLSLML